MKIINHTHYDTRDIMKLIYRVAQDELDPGQLKNRGRITIKYRRNAKKPGDIGGWCYYGTPNQPNVSVRLNLPRNGVDVRALALVIAHELAHARGVKHSQMNELRYKWGTGWQERYAYADAFPIGVKTVVKPTLDEKRTKALAKAQQKVREWETTIKRANTMLKKWKARAKAAERRLSSLPESSSKIASSHVDADALPTQAMAC